MIPPPPVTSVPIPESGFLRKALWSAPAFLLVIYGGFGWKCEVDPWNIETLPPEVSDQGKTRLVLVSSDETGRTMDPGKLFPNDAGRGRFGDPREHGETDGGDDLMIGCSRVMRHGGTYHQWYLFSEHSEASALQEVRYQAYKLGLGFGKVPWSRNTVLTGAFLRTVVGERLADIQVEITEDGTGWLYLILRSREEDRSGVVRMPLRLKRTWYGVS